MKEACIQNFMPHTRRALLAGVVGVTGALALMSRADAQVSSSVDAVPHQFALNLHYLVANFMQGATYGSSRTLPAEHIRAGELISTPGVRVTTTRQVTFTVANRDIEARLREIADEMWFRTLYIRAILRGDTPAQKTIDLSPASFTAMFRAAGAIDSTATFDPYASPLNYLLGAAALIDVYASTLAGLFSQIDNDIARASFAGLVSGAGSDAATIRSMVYERAQTLRRPDLVETVDRLARWRDRIDGSASSDRALSALVVAGQTVTAIAPVDTDGLLLTRTPQQALNVLFMSAGAVSRGGFFPEGLNGTINTSGAN